MSDWYQKFRHCSSFRCLFFLWLLAENVGNIVWSGGVHGSISDLREGGQVGLVNQSFALITNFSRKVAPVPGSMIHSPPRLHLCHHRGAKLWITPVFVLWGENWHYILGLLTSSFGHNWQNQLFSWEKKTDVQFSNIALFFNWFLQYLEFSFDLNVI